MTFGSVPSFDQFSWNFLGFLYTKTDNQTQTDIHIKTLSFRTSCRG